MQEKYRKNIQIFLCTAAAALLVLGIARGELSAVFTKAVNICMECIGIG